MTLHQIVGLFALVIGLIDAGSYLGWWWGHEPRLLGKLRPMQQRLGWVRGTALHFTAYVVVPLAASVWFLLLANG